MKYESDKKRPLLRIAFATAVVSITLSIGGFIEFLATIYPAEASHASVLASLK